MRRSLPPGCRVQVLGQAPEDLVRALWEAGLRPVRGQRQGMLWVVPHQRDQW